MATMHKREAVVFEYKPFHITSATSAITPIGAQVNTTSTTTIVAGSNVTVTPASMANIVEGMLLNFANGTGTSEDVIVKSMIAGTSFTADFVNGHSGAYTIISKRGSLINKVVVNKAGSTDVVLTLYDGSSNLGSETGAPFAIITNPVGPVLDHQYSLKRGLWYTIAGTTIGDYTIGYLDNW